MDNIIDFLLPEFEAAAATLPLEQREAAFELCALTEVERSALLMTYQHARDMSLISCDEHTQLLRWLGINANGNGFAQADGWAFDTTLVQRGLVIRLAQEFSIGIVLSTTTN